VYRAFTSKPALVNPTLIGLEAQIAFLDRAWADPATHVVQLIAAGGTGKTALVDKWFRRHVSEATVFGWSFFSQGSSEQRQTSSDPFFVDIIRWFGIRVAPEDSIYIKAEAVARRLREERVLLLLDGVEPLQDANGKASEIQEHERASTSVVVARRSVETRAFLEPSGKLYDALHVSHDGYVGDVPIVHKSSAVSEVIAQLAIER